ncbi:hypothetical protein HKBW3S09_01189 [Candidatus Hakubella thermalkaliphila]|uniref:Uncharacterized protein n=1 Tax=Candidatus Hakubella thermalkaliphila TaxID=2754717 RepID=A0A6V8NW56_9ACTN|nr:hypothetical protein [Candidatus Hakubella thermalkaliphila]GFP23724.1 hypothetical protein HKBW3S09_01189 [Candidatus Hakubella thermalkaliphila]
MGKTLVTTLSVIVAMVTIISGTVYMVDFGVKTGSEQNQRASEIVDNCQPGRAVSLRHLCYNVRSLYP